MLSCTLKLTELTVVVLFSVHVVKSVSEIVLVFVRFLFEILVLFHLSFLDHYNSSSSSLKTRTDNSSSRFNFRNENYTDSQPGAPAMQNSPPCVQTLHRQHITGSRDR